MQHLVDVEALSGRRHTERRASRVVRRHADVTDVPVHLAAWVRSAAVLKGVLKSWGNKGFDTQAV